jgi:hypothetical protein
LLACWTAPARAQPGADPGRTRSSSLSWVRAPGAEACISTQALAREVERHIGPVFVPPADAELSIEGLVARQLEPQGFIVRIAVSDERGLLLGSRELRAGGPDCRVLDAATALIIALAIDREAAFAALPASLISGLDQGEDPASMLLAELEGSPPAPEPSTGPARRPRKDTALPQTDGGDTRARSSIELELGMALGILVLPERAFGPELAIGHDSKPLGFPAKLRLRYWLPSDIDVANGVVSVSLVQASLVGCPLELLDNWQLRGCLGLSGAALLATGSGFASDNNEVRDAWGGSLELHAAAPLGDALAVALGFSGQVAFNPHRVLAPAGPNGELAEVYRTERLALAVDLGFVFAL